MPIKENDRVSFLNSLGTGVVSAVHGDIVIVVDEDGLEIPVPKSECVLVDDGDFERYDNSKVRKDDGAHVKRAVKPYVIKRGDRCVEIDLHIEKLRPGCHNLSNADILEIQKSTVEAEVRKYSSQRGVSLIFIHGQGEGKLRDFIRAFISQHYPSLKCSDASFGIYGMGGATKVS